MMTTRTRRFRRPNLADTTILKRIDFTPDLWTIWLEKPDGFSFKPGQYCTIGVDGIERAYSIVSAPYEKDLELFVELAAAARRQSHSSPVHAEKRRQRLHTPQGKGHFRIRPVAPEPVFRCHGNGCRSLHQHHQTVPERRTDRTPFLHPDGRELPRRIRIRRRTRKAGPPTIPT